MAAATERGVQLWRISLSDKYVRIEHNDWVNSVSFSNDGKVLATASKDKVYLFKCKDRASTLLTCFDKFSQTEKYTEEIFDSKTKDDHINEISFSPYGKHLALAAYQKVILLECKDNKIIISECKDKNIIESPLTEKFSKEQKHWVNSISFSPKPYELIVSGNSKGIINVYDLKNKKFITKIDIDWEKM